MTTVRGMRSLQFRAAYMSVSRVWSRVGQPSGQISETDYADLVRLVAEHIMARFQNGLPRCEAVDVAAMCLIQFLARLHVRHSTGNALSPEDLFEMVDDACLSAIVGRFLDPNLAAPIPDHEVVKMIFGLHATVSQFESAMMHLLENGQDLQFKIITQYIDTICYGKVPTLHELRIKLKMEISRLDVTRTLIDFSYIMDREADHDRT